MIAPILPLGAAAPAPSVAGFIRDGGFELGAATDSPGTDDATRECASSTSGWCLRRVPGQPPLNEIDCTVSHAGDCSLRLLHRSWGGAAGQRVAIPPAAASVAAEFVFLNPRGGTDWNKWFSVSVLSVDAEGGLRTLGYFESKAPVTEWQRVELPAVELPADAVAVQILLSTGNGCGCYGGTDWATWVDDVVLAFAPVPPAAAHVAGSVLDSAVCAEGAGENGAGAVGCVARATAGARARTIV